MVVMAPGQFKTCEIVPEKACVRLQHDEQFSVSMEMLLVRKIKPKSLRYFPHYPTFTRPLYTR